MIHVVDECCTISNSRGMWQLHVHTQLQVVVAVMKGRLLLQFVGDDYTLCFVLDTSTITPCCTTPHFVTSQ